LIRQSILFKQIYFNEHLKKFQDKL